jgi:hypothetical protein
LVGFSGAWSAVSFCTFKKSMWRNIVVEEARMSLAMRAALSVGALILIGWGMYYSGSPSISL